MHHYSRIFVPDAIELGFDLRIDPIITKSYLCFNVNLLR